MGKVLFITICTAMLLLAACKTKEKTENNGETTTTENLYLGQTPPGLTPKAFAPGLVTTDGWEYGGVFTPDLKEFYFLRENQESDKHELVLIRRIENEWREAAVSPRKGQPVIAPDGKTMHLGRRYKERTETGWSEIKNLQPPFDDILIMRLSASAKGTYYFDTFDKDNLSFPIRYSRLVDGSYEAPKALGENINTGTYLGHPFIAPDESYLIWDAKREDGYGDSDIYISFRQADGTWGKAINLGDQVNTEAWEAAATVTPDGKYLFFNRNMGSDDYENVDIFWVDAQIIETLRDKQ